MAACVERMNHGSMTARHSFGIHLNHYPLDPLNQSNQSNQGDRNA
jgi:hypothetical protein